MPEEVILKDSRGPTAAPGRFSSVEQYLVDATCSLPPPVAKAMAEALASGEYVIRPGSYGGDQAVCPLGAADSHARSEPGADAAWSILTDAEHLGGCLVRFAVSFDLCAAELGADAAVSVIRATLECK